MSDEVRGGEVIEAVWHPHNPEVLGLHVEGVVFKCVLTTMRMMKLPREHLLAEMETSSPLVTYVG